MQSLNYSPSTLNGLVLAGGKSTRMGEDKGLLQWHGKEQRYYIADVLSSSCNEVFISCKKEQTDEIDSKYKLITDEYEDAGPLGAIVSAFHQNKNCAWLVVACDLPLLNKEIIDYLIQERDKTVIATTFKSPYDNLPEPLITIWELAALPLLGYALSERKYSPQRILMNAKIKILEPPDASTLMNVNTLEEKQTVMRLLKEKFSR